MSREQVSVRTNLKFIDDDGREMYYVLGGDVDREELAECHEFAKKHKVRPGQPLYMLGGRLVNLTADKIAVLHALTPDGNPLMKLDSSSVKLVATTYPRKFGK